MLRSKLDIDKHVENCLKKIHSQAERNQRYFSFGRLYFNVGEYEEAQRYLSSYLSSKPKSAEGYHLLGKTLEKLGKNDAALEAYRTSLQLDPKQNNLVIKVCELLAAEDVNLDQSGARYFCEMAQSFDPSNPAVFSLKERLIMTENENPNDVSNLLLKELEDRPTDVNLRIRLLQHFLQHNMIQEAYKHVSDIENKHLPIFDNNIKWYEVVAEVLVRYQRDTSVNVLSWQFWFTSVSVMNKLVLLSLDERSNNHKLCSDYVGTVFNFDQTLLKASQNLDSCPDKQLAEAFITHYSGQLCFHLVTLLYKQAKRDLIKFKDACNITLPLLFIAFHMQPVDLQALWVSHTTEGRWSLVQRWNREASFRCSQVGHMLLSLAKDKKMTLIGKAQQFSSGLWREALFKRAFITREQHIKMNTSYFVTSSQLIDITFRLPDTHELLGYDEVAQLVYPDSLHHYIWLALNQKLSDFSLSAFEGLQYSVKNLNTCAAESLSVLDIKSFIYCATLCAQSQLAEMKNLMYYNPDKPSVLPAALTEQLGTNNQAKFLAAAYKLHKNDCNTDFAELRLLVIKGLEVVRCVGHHGLDAKLLVLLAMVFAERSKKLSKKSETDNTSERTKKVSVISEVEYNDLRAELYWKTVLPLLEKLKNNQAISFSSKRWFEYKAKEMTVNEICSYIEKGRLFIAVQLMKKKELDKALKIFEALRDPYASFYQAQIYKQMADQVTNHNKENLTSEMRSQHIIVLSRARDCLYLTLDRLREPSVDKHHPLNAKLGTEIENIERLLSRIDPDCINRNECDGMSDENVSSADSAGDHYVTGYSLHQSSYMSSTFPQRHESHNIHSTPLRTEILRREARPSPERLDAQLRQLTATKDASISHILEQNKIMVESHKFLVEELRSFKDAVYNLTSTVDELKTLKNGFEELKEVKKVVEGLKNSVDELQNFKNITDIVYEMKREISELKKDVTAKPNQLSEEDLCILDSEYGSDYNIGTQVQPGYNQNLYANYQGRLPGTYGALYPSLYSPMAAAYAYGSLGLPQTGALAFSPEQQIAADLRAIQLGHMPPSATYGQQLHAQSALGQALVQPIVGPSAGTAALSIGQPLLSQVTATNTYPKSSMATSTSSVLYPTLATPAPLNTSGSNLVSNKAPPVNVVITSSDPLPTSLAPVPQKPLSVTIPRQHLKGNISLQPQPHNYQIPLPSTGMTTNVTPSILSTPAPVVTTQSLLSNVAPPVYSAIGEKAVSKNVSLGLEIEKSLDKTFTQSENKSALDKSNLSNASLEEHDPCPDFKPIIPLPDEVPLHTGEEDEIVLFSERAKLFRYSTEKDTKEWKERGSGILKILQNAKTNNIRLLMRRDQVHKICANHFLTADMKLIPVINNNKAYSWAAQDFADQELRTEKFCVRFKSPDEAKTFFNAFQNAQTILKAKQDQNEFEKQVSSTLPSTSKSLQYADSNPSTTAFTTQVGTIVNPGGTSLGGFVFTSTPTFEPKSTEVACIASSSQEVTKSPFSEFSFGKSSNSNIFSNLDFKSSKPSIKSPQESGSGVCLNKNNNEDSHDDFVPTAEFEPVVPLPELVDTKTGEEDAEVLFESKAKLLRLDTSGETNEWKERGLGVMKILKYHMNTIRLVMRRYQVHKVCCNHQVVKTLLFEKMRADPKTVTWCAQDYSEGVVKAETFALRLKTEELADAFLNTLTTAQSTMNDASVVKVDKPDDKDGRQKSVKHVKSEPVKSELNASGSKLPGFGDKFKPIKGSWECKVCYIVNESKMNYCVACDSPKNNTIPPKSSTSETSGSNFSFGVSVTSPVTEFNKISDSSKNKLTFNLTNVTTPVKPTESEIKPIPSGWGDLIKIPVGSWECKACFVRNSSGDLYCLSCQSPKDETIPPKSSAVNLDKPEQKIIFGIPTTVPNVSSLTTTSSTSTFAFGQPSTLSSAQFTFGIPSAQVDTAVNKTPTFSFLQKSPVATSPEKDSGASGDKFVFGSPQKHDFGFMPKSPRHLSGGQGDDDSDGSYEEEADNIYFKPLIPLPDKVDVITGEEEEEVLYCQRAKLFRFVDSEWKERGLGDLKVLKNKKSCKTRVLMRREQVLKICLNHMLTNDIDYKPKDEKTWLFSAPDFSDGEIQHGQFCVRFKTAELAQEFKKAVTDAKLSHKSSPVKIEVQANKNDSDVEFISETKVTSEEEKEANSLGLPPKFMSYRQLPDCTCSQCKKDDEYFGDASFSSSTKDISKKSSSSLAKSTSSHHASTTISPFITPLSAFGTPSTEGSVFGTPIGESSKWSGSSNSSSPNLKSLLIKPPQFNIVKNDSENRSPLYSASTGFFSTNQPTTTSSRSSSDTSTSGCITSGNFFGSKTTPTIFESDNLPSTKDSGSKAFSFSAPKLNSMFGGASTNTAPVPSATTPTNIFNTNLQPFTSSMSKSGTFGSTPATTTSATLFGVPTQNSNIFSSSGSIFGAGSPKPGSLFSNTSIFGDGKSFSSNASIFSQTQKLPSATPVVGASIFASSAPPGTGSLVFGSAPVQASIPDKPSTLGSQVPCEPNKAFTFTAASKSVDQPPGSLAQSAFVSKEPSSADTGFVRDDVVLKCEGNLSFASLAAKNSDSTTPAFLKQTDEATPFTFHGAGTPVFASLKQKDVDRSTGNENQEGDGNEEGTADEEYDPHYEPIVPLPDAIVVSTGEEDEVVEFNERSKLFRFDALNKEWKERGVGQLKILHHPIDRTYRFLMRREQVHKVVLNQRITPELDMQPMSTSDRAWIWAGYNYTEDGCNLEQLSIKFKNCELSKKFYDIVQNVISTLQEIQANKSLPSVIQNYGVEDVSSPESSAVQIQEISNDPGDEYEEEDDEVDDEDEKSIMFAKRCLLSEENSKRQWVDVGEGEVKVYYDPDFYCARIGIYSDNGENISNTLIGMNTEMQIKDKCCVWRAVEWIGEQLEWRKLKVTFASEDDALEFYSNYDEGVQCAKQCNITDHLPTGNSDESED